MIQWETDRSKLKHGEYYLIWLDYILIECKYPELTIYLKDDCDDYTLFWAGEGFYKYDDTINNYIKVIENDDKRIDCFCKIQDPEFLIGHKMTDKERMCLEWDEESRAKINVDKFIKDNNLE